MGFKNFIFKRGKNHVKKENESFSFSVKFLFDCSILVAVEKLKLQKAGQRTL
jgi:hypothetical protein